MIYAQHIEFFISNYFYSLIFLILIPFTFSYLITRRSRLSIDIFWILGLIILGIFIIILHAHGFSKDFTFTFIYIVAFLSFILFLRNIKRHEFINNIISLKLLVYLIASIFAFETLLIAYFEPITAGDSLAYWWSKTKAMYQWEPLSNFLSPQYPHLGSTLWMLAINYSDGKEFVGRGLFATLQAILFISFCFTLNLKKFDFISKAVYAATIISSYIFLVKLDMGGGYTFTYSGYMDWLVAIIPCFGYFLFIHKNIIEEKLQKYKLSTDNIIIILIFSSAALVKAEGYVDMLIYTTSTALCFFIFASNKFGTKTLIHLILSISLILLIANINNYIYFVNDILVESTHVFNFENILFSYQNIFERTPLIIDYLIKSISRISLLYIIYTVLLIGAIIIKRYDLALISSMPILLYYAFIYLVFLSTTSPLEWHLSSAFYRLNYHIVLIMVFSNIIFIKFLLDEYIAKKTAKVL